MLRIREINRFLEKFFERLETRNSILETRNSKLEPRNSILDSRKHRVSRIEFRVETVNLHLKGTVQCPNVLFCTDACTCKVLHYYGVTDCRLKPATDITMSSDQFTDCNVGHIIPARREECKNVIFPVTSVQALCVLVDCGHKQCVFVCKLPNRCEKD